MASSIALATEPAAAPARPYARLDSIDHFRAFAIISVVMIHAGNAFLLRGIGIGDAFSPERTALHLLVHNATVYFAFISGLLYSHCLWRKPHRTFIRSRFLNVVVPYAIVSIMLTLLLDLRSVIGGGDAVSMASLAQQLAYNVFLGEAWNTLWYIPVITVIYIYSPLLLAMASDRKWRLALVLVLLAPLVISRTGTAVTPSMIIYYTGVYLWGVIVGLDYERSLRWIRDHGASLAIAGIIAALAIVVLDYARFEFIGPVSIRESCFFVLRLCIAAWTVRLMDAATWPRGGVVDRNLKLIAGYAFGIYFIHGPLLRPVATGIGSLMPDGGNWLAVTLGIGACFLVGLLASILIVHVVKRLTGSWSKFLIGA